MLNASQRLISRLRRCDNSSLKAPALPLLPVAPYQCRLSRQLNQRQPPWSPDLRRIGEIEGAHTRHDATLSRSAKDPTPRSPWIQCLRNPPEQPGRKRRGPSLATAGPPRKQPLLCLSPPRLVLSVFMDPHGPTIAPRCPTAVIADKIKHMHFQKESKNLFLPTISVLPLCSQSAQPFQPLATWAEAWQAMAVSTCVMTTVRRGYTLQFAQRTPRFRGVLATTVCSENTQVLCAEVMNLLEKGAIEIVPPAQSESGFYSRYFLVPKKEGGMQPILDLRLLNYALMKKSFRVITLKQILPQICPGNGLCSWR